MNLISYTVTKVRKGAKNPLTGEFRPNATVTSTREASVDLAELMEHISVEDLVRLNTAVQKELRARRIL